MQNMLQVIRIDVGYTDSPSTQMVIRKLINVFRIPDAAQNSTNDFVLRPGIIIT